MDTEDQTAELSPQEAVAALEEFVINNDELLELEEQIGRFNIFDALGVVRQEIRHSNFLAWLLDPAESHGQGQLFLKAILMDLLRVIQVENGPLSPIDLDGIDLVGVEVRREWRHLDILIVANDPKVVIAIENKIDSGEHDDQLQRYHQAVLAEYPNHNSLFVYLTPQGDEPSRKPWHPYTYQGIYQALDLCVRRNSSLFSDDVLIFIRHYLNIIENRLMNSPITDRLCKHIYHNNRSVVEMLTKQSGIPAVDQLRRKFNRNHPQVRIEIGKRYGNLLTEIQSEFMDILRQDKIDWHAWKDRLGVHFLPRDWLGWLPPIRDRVPIGPRRHTWLFAQLKLRSRSIKLNMYVTPTVDDENKAIEWPHKWIRKQIEVGKCDAGFQIFPEPDPSWTRFYSKQIASDENDIAATFEITNKMEEWILWLKSQLPQMEVLLREAIQTHRHTEEHQS